jgi:hypothetical protein
MDNDLDAGLLMGYVLYRLPIEPEFMDLELLAVFVNLEEIVRSSA